MNQDDDFYDEIKLILDISLEKLQAAEKMEFFDDYYSEIEKIMEYTASINAIRSIFDRIMWHIADNDLRIPIRRNIKFPVFYSQSSFKNWWNSVEHLYSKYDGIKDFLDSVQPYGIIPKSNKEIIDIDNHLHKFNMLTHFVFLLSAFDNASKHRVRLVNDSNRSKSRSRFDINDKGEIEREYPHHAFTITEYNADNKAFTISTPESPELFIKYGAEHLVRVFKTEGFGLRFSPGNAEWYSMELSSNV